MWQNEQNPDEMNEFAVGSIKLTPLRCAVPFAFILKFLKINLVDI